MARSLQGRLQALATDREEHVNMSQRNPIHRDGGRRDEGEQPYRDNKQAFAEKEAEVQRNAPLTEDEATPATEDERTAAQAEAAGKRFDEIARNQEH
jgi:hypothetical protein